MNNQDNISFPEISTPIILFTEKSKLAKTEDNDFKYAIISMFNELKEDIN